MFLVRVLFCLCAEDTGVFGRDVFTDFIVYRTPEDGRDLGLRLEQFFRVLDTPKDRRQRHTDELLARLDYVNGALFSGHLAFAEMNSAMHTALLACTEFDWSRISPDIFGSLFRGVMDAAERRAVGAHYTAEDNNLKLIGDTSPGGTTIAGLAELVRHGFARRSHRCRGRGHPPGHRTWEMIPITRVFALSQPASRLMLRHMSHRLIASACLSLATLCLSSCGVDPDAPILAGNTQNAATEGEALYQKAKQADDAGKTGRAIKYYDKTATRYPFAPSASQARYRQAQLLEQEGEIEDAFDAYDKFLQRYPGSSHYVTALNRQAAMAQGAADGDVKSSFLGLKTRLSLEKTVEMLGKVRDHAPKSRPAAKAQFTIGELYQAKEKTKESIEAFRQLVRDQPDCQEAPESLFRVGQILMEDAERGNQNQANLDLAREAFNDYLIQYPRHSRNAEARKLLEILSGRDLQRSFDIAEFYLKTGKTESAKVYYRDILKRTGSGDLHDASKARLKELGE